MQLRGEALQMFDDFMAGAVIGLTSADHEFQLSASHIGAVAADIAYACVKARLAKLRALSEEKTTPALVTDNGHGTG
jgi:uncharacterized membrane protein